MDANFESIVGGGSLIELKEFLNAHPEYLNQVRPFLLLLLSSLS
jgi:hypothetical protein